MPIIPPEEKIGKKPLNISLPIDRLTTLHAYAAFINGSSVQHVLGHLIGSLEKDAEFREWRKANASAVMEITSRLTAEESTGPKPAKTGKAAA